MWWIYLIRQQSQIRSVMNILIPVTPGPALIVLNKIDHVDGDTLALAQEEFPQAVFISSERLGLETPATCPADSLRCCP